MGIFGGKKDEETKAPGAEVTRAEPVPQEKPETELDRLMRQKERAETEQREIEAKASECGEQERGLRFKIRDLEQRIPALTSLDEIERAVGELEEATRKLKALQIYRGHVHQVVEAARGRTRSAEEAIQNLYRRVTWIKETAIPHSRGNIADHRHHISEAQKIVNYRSQEIATEEAGIRRMQDEVKSLTGEDITTVEK